MAIISELSLSELRRNLHAYPEIGWKEFRTTALIAEELEERGFIIHLGAAAVNPDSRMGVPDDVPAAWERAREEGAPEEYLDRMGDITGLVAEKRYGDGPVVGIRTDIDALNRQEATDEDHRPAREGFASTHLGEMHACGHDGHAAIGVGVAREIDTRGGFDGTLKHFFQPAEEGGRGGKPMSETDHLNDVDHFLAVHLGLGLETGEIIAGRERPLPNTKLDVTFDGAPAHSGHEPNEGRNAMQAAAAAIQNLYGIPRHSDGKTRINVGQVHSPNPQNIIPEEATMRVETRGETTPLNEYVLENARRIVQGAADMHEVACSTSLYGAATTFDPDESMVQRVVNACQGHDGVANVIRRQQIGGSEDAAYLINRVQETGGKATYVGIGASNPDGHHTARFDIDEASLDLGVEVVVSVVRNL